MRSGLGGPWSLLVELSELCADRRQRRFGGETALLDYAGSAPELEHPEVTQIGIHEDVDLTGPVVAELVLHDLQDPHDDVEAARQARVRSGFDESRWREQAQRG